MTIAAPELVVDKTGPATMNLGEWGDFAIDVANTGLERRLGRQHPRPASRTAPQGGMCEQTPEILSAQVFAADGVTPVPGKPALNPGSDYTLSYSAAPSCALNMTMLTPAGVIGPNERLIIRYRTQLDSDTQDGVALTNVAGAHPVVQRRQQQPRSRAVRARPHRRNGRQSPTTKMRIR